MAKKIFNTVKNIFITVVIVLSTVVFFFIFGFSFTAKANTRDVAFHLDNSFAGSTFFSYNAIQQWREF